MCVQLRSGLICSRTSLTALQTSRTGLCKITPHVLNYIEDANLFKAESKTRTADKEREGGREGAETVNCAHKYHPE